MDPPTTENETHLIGVSKKSTTCFETHQILNFSLRSRQISDDFAVLNLSNPYQSLSEKKPSLDFLSHLHSS